MGHQDSGTAAAAAAVESSLAGFDYSSRWNQRGTFAEALMGEAPEEVVEVRN